jgi:hypothetical protein
MMDARRALDACPAALRDVEEIRRRAEESE